MSNARRMGAVDSIWLTMDRPDNLMVIDSVMWFDDVVDPERLRAVIQHRLVERYPVFHQVAIEPANPFALPHWQDDPNFSLDRHLRHVVLPEPGDDGCLERYVESQLHLPLDRTRPLWEVHLVTGYRGGSAVVTRFHHALADGIALARVLLALTDAEPTSDLTELVDEDAEEGQWYEEDPKDASGWLQGTAATLTGPASSVLRSGLHLLKELPRSVTSGHAVEALTLALQTGQIADKLLLGSNPDTPLSGPPGVPKRAVWSKPWPLADVKVIGRLAGATVNDVLVGAVSGALATYLVDHGGDARDLTTMVPVNLRRLDQPLPRTLGNQFALVMLPLPTGVLAPLERMSEAKRRMDSIKSSPEAYLTFGIINAIGRTNPEVARYVVDFFAAKAIGVTTNVMGPVTGRYVAGSRIAGLLGWVPGSGAQTVGVSIFSYDQFVRIGFKVDAGVVPDPEKLVHAFDEEMAVLLRIADAA